MSGLLHGIGRLAINKALTAPTGEPLKTPADEGFPRDHSGAETAIFGFTQADVGACMLEKWAFAEENVESVRNQYEPLEAEEPHDRMSAVLYCARFLRSATTQPEPPADLPGMEDVFQSLRLTRDDLLGYLTPLQEQVARAMQLMKV